MKPTIPPSTPAGAWSPKFRSPAALLPAGAWLFSLPLLLAGCGDSKVTSYRIPKENAAAVAAAAAAPAAPAAPADMSANQAFAKAGGLDLQWTAPATWQPKTASAMRKGSYTVGAAGGPTADLSITAFPGDVGGELANVNRWRGQFNLPPVAEADLAGAVARFSHDGLDFAVVDLAAGEQRLLGVIVPFNGVTWFFKLTGPEALVAQEKPVFLVFLQSVKPPAGAEVVAAPVASQPAAPAGVSAPMTGAVATSAEGGAIIWTAPTHWQVKPATAMRKGSFTVAGEGGTVADLSITAFPGAVGGEFANVNRWRGQLALPPLAENDLAAAVSRLEAGGLAFTVVDFAGSGATPQRILGAMAPHDGAMWFFKLMGPADLVAREKPAFLDFLRTVRVAPASSP